MTTEKPRIVINICKDCYTYKQGLYISYMVKHSEDSIKRILDDSLNKTDSELDTYMQVKFGLDDAESFMLENM